MQRLLLVRHGETAWNAENRFQGWADIPLNANGEAQAKRAAVTLQALLPDDRPIHFVATSDLARARQTAEILREPVCSADLQIDTGLRERDVGDWSGLTVLEIEARWPGLLSQWHTGELQATPNGETTSALIERALDCMTNLFERAPKAATLVAVTHGGVMRVIEEHFGVTPRGTANLGGRWVHLDQGQFTIGETLAL
ncbi:MAG: histidine phosphatase family protein [Tepidiformaceae bacterium]